MALGKHNARVQALAERIARALGNALVAPVIAYVPEGSVDPPTAHMRYPGTHHRAAPTCSRRCSSPRRAASGSQGFRDIVFLGDHGGYQKRRREPSPRLDREWAARRRCACTRSPSTTARRRRVRAVVDAASGFTRRRDRHACRARRHVAHARRRSGAGAHRPARATRPTSAGRARRPAPRDAPSSAMPASTIIVDRPSRPSEQRRATPLINHFPRTRREVRRFVHCSSSRRRSRLSSFARRRSHAQRRRQAPATRRSRHRARHAAGADPANLYSETRRRQAESARSRGDLARVYVPTSSPTTCT